jgi:hypothetical protein
MPPLLEFLAALKSYFFEFLNLKVAIFFHPFQSALGL